MTLSNNEKARLKTKYGNWAIVTGASSGIGLELACQLASAGLNLLISSRDEKRLKEVESQLKAIASIEVKIVAADVAEAAGTALIIQAAQGLDVGLLVASAGYGTSGKFMDNTLDDEINMLRVNCEALLALTHHYSRQFAKQRRGGIILMSSMVSFQGTPYAANYAATKAYVQTLAEGLAEEMKPYGVDILAAAPGPVATGFSSRANMKMKMTLNPAEVGVPILKALGRKTTVLPGFITKLIVYSLSIIPRWLKIKMMGVAMGGMTAHQRK